MVASDLAAAHKQFKQAFDKGDAATCTRLLSNLKLLLAKAGALGVNESTVTANNEDLAMARDVLEHAVFLGIKQEDETMFERNYAQLKTLYAVTRTPLGPSPREMLLVGLNMMRLLVQNRIAEFHTELELIPPEAQRTGYMRLPIQLEQWLMEGAYNKVLTAKGEAPDPLYLHFLDLLSNTVRDEIASCSERAYAGMTVESARKLLMFGSAAETESYCRQHGWDVASGRITFQADMDASAGAAQLSSMQLINNSLTYAKELERIV